MSIEIKVPEAGESILQVELARWLVSEGTYVEKDQEIAEIDSDKATLTISAAEAGVISIVLEEGSSAKPGQVIGHIDTKADKPKSVSTEESPEAETRPDEKTEARPNKQTPPGQEKETNDITLTPQAKKQLDEWEVDVSDIMRPDSRRITRKDILQAISQAYHQKQTGDGTEIKRRQGPQERREETQKMSTLRKKIAQRLVAVKNETAMLTTFNEVDMTAIIQLRKQHQQAFTEKYGFKLGFMSFFAKAVTQSLTYFPGVNGRIDGEQIITPSYVDLGIAVSTPKGLMVPVIRDADQLSLAQLEQAIQHLAEKARINKISMEELTGGTFSITNGGVFGSLLSTPIINPPQSAILGMHTIQERPVAIDGKVEIRPMMYIALSYDHRIIDGKESVGFVIKLKSLLENPLGMLTDGQEPGKVLLGL
jgi:2-oxoglutarate dehydrogenase E2 component (dihydrolipoamide succinyltransferase)